MAEQQGNLITRNYDKLKDTRLGKFVEKGLEEPPINITGDIRKVPGEIDTKVETGEAGPEKQDLGTVTVTPQKKLSETIKEKGAVIPVGKEKEQPTIKERIKKDVKSIVEGPGKVIDKIKNLKVQQGMGPQTTVDVAPDITDEEYFKMTLKEQIEYENRKKTEKKKQEQLQFLAENDLISNDIENAKADIKPRAPLIGKNPAVQNLVPVDKNMDLTSDDVGNFVYFPRNKEFGYIIKNVTPRQAEGMANKMYDYMIENGTRYYTPAIPELNTYVRRVAEASGNWEDLTKIAREWRPKRFDNIMKNLEKDPILSKLPVDMRSKFAAFTVNSMYGLHAIPSFVFTMGIETTRTIDELLGILPFYNGLLIDTTAAVLSHEQEKNEIMSKFAQEMDMDTEDVRYLDDSLYWNEFGEVKQLSSNGNTIRITGDELRSLKEYRVDPDILVGATRMFAQDFGLSLSILGSVGLKTLKHSNQVAELAKNNLIKRGVPKNKITRESVYGEMRRMHQSTYSKAKEKHGFQIRDYIKRVYNEQKTDFYYDPAKYFREIAAAETGVALGWKVMEDKLDFKLRHMSDEDFEYTWEDVGLNLLGATLGGISTVATYKAGRLVVDRGMTMARGVANAYKQAMTLPILNVAKPVFELMSLGPDAIRRALDSDDPITNLNVNDEMKKRIRSMLESHLDLQGKHPDAGPIFIAAANRNLTLIEDFQELGLQSKDIDKVFMTIGMLFENDIMRAAEIENLQAARSGTMKMDAKFKWLVEAHTLQGRRENLQVAIGTVLATLGEVQLPVQSDINKLKDYLEFEQVKIEGEQARYKNIIDNAVVFQVVDMLDGANLDTETYDELQKILINHPSLKINPETAVPLQTAEKMLIAQNHIVQVAVDQFRDRLVDIKKYKYLKNEEGVATIATDNVQKSGRIIEYVSDVGLTSLERFDDGIRRTGQIQYTEAFDHLERLPTEITNVNVTDSLIEINKNARSNLVDETGSYLGRVNKIIEPAVQRVLERNLEVIAGEINKGQKKKGSNVRYEPADIKRILAEKILNDPEMVGRVGKVPTNLDIIEYMSKMPSLKDKLNVNMNMENFNKLRQFTNMQARKMYKTDTNKADTLDGISTQLDNNFSNHVKNIRAKAQNQKVLSGPLQKGESVMHVDDAEALEIAAKKLEEAEIFYHQHYKNKSRQGSLLGWLDNYSQRTDTFEVEGNTKLAKEANKIKHSFSFVDKKSPIPTPKNFNQGPNSGGRIRDKRKGSKFWDDLFNDYTPDELAEELIILFGDPVIKKDGSIGYIPPQEGSLGYDQFGFFIEQMNTYISAKFAKEYDLLEAKGKVQLFAGKIDDAVSGKRTMADIENTLKRTGVPPALADGEFANKVSILHQELYKRTEGRFEILGKSMHKDVFQLATKNEEVREELVTVVKTLQNAIKTKTPEIKKYQGEVEYLFTLGKAVNKIATAPKNSEEFLDMTLGTIRIDDVTGEIRSSGLERLIEAAAKNKDEKVVRETIARILGVGIMNKYTMATDKHVWKHTDALGDLNVKEKKMVGKETNLAAERKTIVQGERKQLFDMAGYDANKAPRLVVEKIVDGPSLVDFLQQNEDVLIKYLRGGDAKTYKKIQVIAKLSARTVDPNVSLALRDATHGNVKFGFNTAMSRIAAVYSGRASIRYPLIEMSFALMQKREAESVAALLTANKDFVDLVYDTMINGKVNMKKFNPRIIESYVADVVMLNSNTFQGIINSNRNSTLEELTTEAYLEVLGIDSKMDELFPFPQKRYNERIGKYGNKIQTQTREYNLVEKKRKQYYEYMADRLREGIKKEDGSTYNAIYNQLLDKYGSRIDEEGFLK